MAATAEEDTTVDAVCVCNAGEGCVNYSVVFDSLACVADYIQAIHLVQETEGGIQCLHCLRLVQARLEIAAHRPA